MTYAMELARRKAVRYFQMAIKARDKGNFELAELLTEAACRCLDRDGGTVPAAP
jgi:hypothetical protein